MMQSSFLLNVCPSQFHFLLRIWSSNGSWPVFSHNSSSAILSSQCILRILRKHLLIKKLVAYLSSLCDGPWLKTHTAGLLLCWNWTSLLLLPFQLPLTSTIYPLLCKLSWLYPVWPQYLVQCLLWTCCTSQVREFLYFLNGTLCHCLFVSNS